MMMNSSTAEERQSLVRNELGGLNWDVTEREQRFVAQSTTKMHGQIVAVPGYVLFGQHFQLLNRDMLLMVENTMIALYASKLSLVSRADGQDGPLTLEKLTELYIQGNLLKERMGKNVYEVIKLVEPHCTYQMSLIVHKNMPLIPTD